MGYSVLKGEKPEKAFILMNSSRTVELEMGSKTWKLTKRSNPS